MTLIIYWIKSILIIIIDKIDTLIKLQARMQSNIDINKYKTILK